MTKRERTRMELLVAGFIEAMEARGWSPRTIENYSHAVRSFVSWLDAETDLVTIAEVTTDTVSTYQTSLLTVEVAEGRLLSVATRNGRLVGLKAFFRWLVQGGKLLVDPAAGIALAKRHAPLPQALLTPREAVRLLETIPTSSPIGLRDRAILEVFYATGIRLSELAALAVADVDVETAMLHVRRGKGGRGRVVPLGPMAAEILREYLVRGRPVLLGSARSDALFLSQRHRRCHPNTIRVIVDRAARRAGITKPVRPHRLRHACATHMLRGGADIRHVQQLLGHRTLGATQIYTKVEISDLAAVHRRYHPREKGRR